MCCSDDNIRKKKSNCKKIKKYFLAKKESLYQDLERPSLSPWDRDEDEGFH